MESLIIGLLIGLAAGWVAGQIMGGRRPYGLLGDLVLGLIGGVAGSWLFGVLGIAAGGYIGYFVTALVGAILLIFLVRLIKRA